MTTRRMYPSIQKVEQTPSNLLRHAMTALETELEFLAQLGSNIRQTISNSNSYSNLPEPRIMSSMNEASKRLERAIKSLVSLEEASRRARHDASNDLQGLSDTDIIHDLLHSGMLPSVLDGLAAMGYVVHAPTSVAADMHTPIHIEQDRYRGGVSQKTPVSDGMERTSEASLDQNQKEPEINIPPFPTSKTIGQEIHEKVLTASRIKTYIPPGLANPFRAKKEDEDV